MADEPQVAAGEGALTGFEGYSLATLKRIKANLEGGLAEVHGHMGAGTAFERPKPGAATPKEAGYTILMLSDQIDLVIAAKEGQA